MSTMDIYRFKSPSKMIQHVNSRLGVSHKSPEITNETKAIMMRKIDNMLMKTSQNREHSRNRRDINVTHE